MSDSGHFHSQTLVKTQSFMFYKFHLRNCEHSQNALLSCLHYAIMFASGLERNQSFPINSFRKDLFAKANHSIVLECIVRWPTMSGPATGPPTRRLPAAISWALGAQSDLGNDTALPVLLDMAGHPVPPAHLSRSSSICIDNVCN